MAKISDIENYILLNAFYFEQNRFIPIQSEVEPKIPIRMNLKSN